MTWMLKDNFFNMLKKTKLDVHIKFRTRDPDGGVLLHLPSNSYEFISLQVRYFYLEFIDLDKHVCHCIQNDLVQDVWNEMYWVIFFFFQIINGHVAVIYNLKDYDNSMMENVISLSAAPAANGQWHSLSMKRIGRWFQLKMDSGEGRYYNETWGSLQDSQFFNLKRDQIVSGSLVKFRPNANFHSKDLRDSKWQFSDI